MHRFFIDSCQKTPKPDFSEEMLADLVAWSDTWPSWPRGTTEATRAMANPAAAAQHQARGGDGAAGRPAAEQAPPRGTAACTVTPRVRARARLRPPRPARRAAAHRARSASGLPPRQPARGCWAGAGADARRHRARGGAPWWRLLRCRAAGRAVAAPRLVRGCAAAAGFAMARVCFESHNSRLA